MKLSLSSFLAGFFGAIAGVFVVFLFISFGFFKIINKIETVSLTCEKEKISRAHSIECQILEVEDLGNLLKVEDAALLPPGEKVFIKDQTTLGKFIKVKYKIKNNRNEKFSFFESTLIDKSGRKYYSEWPLRYWIPEEYQTDSILPGLEREIIEIFEVAKDSQEPFKLKVKFQIRRFFD
jgi:hypothetical protein